MVSIKPSKPPRLGLLKLRSGLLLVITITSLLSTVLYMRGMSMASDEGKLLLETSTSSSEQAEQESYDVCVVGAGLSGAVLAERHATEFNHKVLVVEKRDHIGGNCFDYIDKETGIRVSKYGMHLFHTKYQRVQDYVQRFSKWTPYEHRVLARVEDKHVPVPVNIDTVNELFNLTISSEKEMKRWLEKTQIAPPNGEATNSEEVGLQRVGRRLYDLIFKPYTIKQWNKDPKQLGPSVLARIPVRSNHDDRYFTDPFQALPNDGYTQFFENMLTSSPNIKVRLNTNYFQVRDSIECGHTYFTGPIDAYFASKGLPKLEYRSLEFEEKIVHNVTGFYLPAAVVNHPPPEYNFTRVAEYKHLLNQESDHTVLVYESSSDVGEPYYPVPNEKNHALYAKYQKMAEQEPDVSFVGRLASYKYFNMDQAVLNALELFDKFPSCTPGTFSSVEEWIKLFPGGRKGLGLKQKALVFIPVGKRAAKKVNEMILNLGTENYDFLLVRYDDYDWSQMEWYDKVEWEVQPPNEGAVWTQAKKHLTPERTAQYSHVCRWDDDLTPTEDFDGDVFLQWMQQLNLGIVQPMIRKNSHVWFEGTSVEQRRGKYHVHQVHVVEVMAPCYDQSTWANCIWPGIIARHSTGWGIDVTLHRAECAPPFQHTVRLPLDHNNFALLNKDGGDFSFWHYRIAAILYRWKLRNYKNPLKNFKVSVDRSCRVSMWQASKSSVITPR